MIPEREREALMRLTMCAREECRICMYQKRCDFDFQYELATKNMNILADALRADRKTEPTSSKMEQVEDEPQTDCDGCQHYADEYTADACYECKRSYKDRYEPHTEREGE